MNIANTIEHADLRHPADTLEPKAAVEAQTLAAEALARVFAWVADGRTLDERGFRSTVAIFTVRPDLFGGVSLERLGEKVGRTKQAVWKLQQEFRHVVVMEN